MDTLLFIALIGTFIAIVMDLLGQLPYESRRGMRNWLITWFIKGAAIPLVVWTIFNTGVFDNLPDFVSSRMMQRMSFPSAGLPPNIAAAINSGVHWNARLALLIAGLIVILTYWMALTSGWLLAMLSAYAVNFREVVLDAKWSTLALGAVALMLFVSYGWPAIGVAATLALLPVLKASAHAVGVPVVRHRPSYSKATAELHRGKYEAAEQTVIAMLERCEDDFDGWMMLADLYANHFNDLPAAERMIEETCEQPSTTISEAAVAYHRLADWYLNLENNPEAAIKALQQISRRYPNTHVDRMARLRIRKLTGEKGEPAKPEELRTIALPSLGRDVDVIGGSAHVDNAVGEARRCSELLTKDPNDIATREKFARLLAEQLNQPELAMEQIQLLIDLGATDTTALRRPEWLLLAGTWQLKYRNNEAAAVELFRKLIHEHTQTTQAFAAQRRLKMIEMEHQLRRHRTGHPVDLPTL